MKNIITTIPARDDLKHWHLVEPMLGDCTDEDNFWTFSCRYFPKGSGPGAICFIVHSGFVRGYFTILDFSAEPLYRSSTKVNELDYKEGNKIKLITFRPISPIAMKGFQGWRYTSITLL